MAEQTGISWADATFNPWIGCTKVGPGCDNCYAERDMAVRRKVVEWGPGAERKHTSASNWKEPLKWNRKAEVAAALDAKAPRPRVFCASLADVFDNEVPDEWRAQLWELICATPYLDWMLLTKRIGNVERMVPPRWLHKTGYGFPRNVWLGATMVTQEEYDRDMPKLAAFRDFCRVLWLSIEPQIGPIELGPHVTGVDWVITGGESGRSNPRPYDIWWARSLLGECRRANVAVHVKQLGSNAVAGGAGPYPTKHWKGADMAEWPEDIRVQEFPR